MHAIDETVSVAEWPVDQIYGGKHNRKYYWQSVYTFSVVSQGTNKQVCGIFGQYAVHVRETLLVKIVS